MAEAIQWANRPQPTITKIVAGRRVVERIPQTASFGTYDSPTQAPPRWRKVIDSYGNELRVPMTTAAADLDTEGGYGRLQRSKWRHFGWYEVGHCPCAMFMNNELGRNHFVSQEVLASALAGKACQPGTYSVSAPCEHSIAEMEARRNLNVQENNERMRAFQSESDKIIAANAKHSQDMALQVASAVASAMAQATSPKEKAGK